MNPIVRKYGYKKDKKDDRDYKFTAIRPLASLPTSIDLRQGCPPVYDQGQLGSCTANAIAGAIQFELMKRKATDESNPSRLFIYYNERVIEGTVSEDSGAEIRDGVKSVNKQGVCDESICPYVVSKFAKKPTKKAYASALQDVITSYQSINQDLVSIKSALASGYPVVFGFEVYEAFESDAVAQTGILPMPIHGEQLLGGHAVAIVGYDDAKQWFIVRNSWGAGWGDKGYFYMPYSYATSSKYASDFWLIKM